MHQKVPVRQGKKICKKPMLEAILDIHGRKAANGDVALRRPYRQHGKGRAIS